ncbi:MAG: sigma-70 family RNA polymerase sigma factor [Bacteroidota bacterium]|nr:sigma-70 family RNA polymerase sigma factor [Bacteroidota bacterium]
MDNLVLNELIERSRKHDEKAFRQIVEQHQQQVYSLAFRLLCNEEEAKDIVQETFIRIWLKLDDYDQTRKFTTWLYAIATNLCLDKLKHARRSTCYQASDEELTKLIDPEDIEKTVINSELCRLILALTNELTPKQRIVFTLRDLEELDVEEVSRITGLSASQIKSNLFLARQAIRKKINIT